MHGLLDGVLKRPL